MRKMNNKGFSMVEILISIAIFAVLMIPIVNAIISSLKNTTNAKELQYRNEFVENIVEYVKQDSLDNVFKGDYFETIGSYTTASGDAIAVDAKFHKKSTDASYDPSLKPVADSLLTYAGLDMSAKTENTDVIQSGRGSDLEQFPYEDYMISGKVDLGAKDTTYVYKMQISNKYYANKEKDAVDNGGKFINPNNLAIGVVEDIDYTKIALINGTIANYDTTVYNAFYTKKVEILKEKDPYRYSQFLGQVNKAKYFSFDTCKRLITIEVTGSEADGYTVACKLKYHDDGATYPDLIGKELANYNIEYKPFDFEYPAVPIDSSDPNSKKVAKLPNIYLMYNVSKYNNDFSLHDYIEIDTSGVKDDTIVKCFIVETAEKYSDNITDANSELDANKTLHSDYSYTKKTRNDVTIHIAAKVKGNDKSKLKNLYVYHNFDMNGTAGTKNGKILYEEDQPGLFDSNFFLESEHVPLITNDASGVKIPNQSAGAFDSLNKAKEESRGLYEIKVWISEGDDPSIIDTDNDIPIMTATKGGDES